MQYLDKEKEKLHNEPIYIEGSKDDIIVEVALQYCETYHEVVSGYANNINTHEGGTHLTGLRRALTSTVNKYARDVKMLKEKDLSVVIIVVWEQILFMVLQGVLK